MANDKHSEITDATELHVSKGFTEAANSTAEIKNELGNSEWRLLSVLGETGPAGPREKAVRRSGCHPAQPGSAAPRVLQLQERAVPRRARGLPSRSTLHGRPDHRDVPTRVPDQAPSPQANAYVRWRRPRG